MVLRPAIKPTGVAGISGVQSQGSVDFTTNPSLGNWLTLENTDQALVDAGAILLDAQTKTFEFVSTPTSLPTITGAVPVVLGKNIRKTAANLAEVLGLRAQLTLRIGGNAPGGGSGGLCTLTQGRPAVAGDTAIVVGPNAAAHPGGGAVSWAKTDFGGVTSGVDPTGDCQIIQAEFDAIADGDTVTFSDLDAGSSPQKWIWGGPLVDDAIVRTSRNGVEVAAPLKISEASTLQGDFYESFSGTGKNWLGRAVYCNKRFTLKGSGVDGNGNPLTDLTSEVPFERWTTAVTTASGALTAGDVEIPVASSADFPAQGVVNIEREGAEPEQVFYSSKTTGPDKLILDKGTESVPLFGTPLKLSHSSGVTVELSDFATDIETLPTNVGSYPSFYRMIYGFNRQFDLGASQLVTTVAGASHVDGELVTIDDGQGETVVFEYDDDASVSVGNVAIDITGSPSADVMRDRLITAINDAAAFPPGRGLKASAFANGPATVRVKSATSGGIYDSYYPWGPFTETLASISTTVADGGFKVVQGYGHSLYLDHKRVSISDLHFDSGAVTLELAHSHTASRVNFSNTAFVPFSHQIETRSVYPNWTPSDNRNFSGKKEKSVWEDCVFDNTRAFFLPQLASTVKGCTFNLFFVELGSKMLSFFAEALSVPEDGRHFHIVREVTFKDNVVSAPVDATYQGWGVYIVAQGTTLFGDAALAELVTIKNNSFPDIATKDSDDFQTPIGIHIRSRNGAEVRDMVIRGNTLGNTVAGIIARSQNSGSVIDDVMVTKQTFNGGRPFDGRHRRTHDAGFFNGCEVFLRTTDGGTISGWTVSNNEYSASGAPGINETATPDPFKGCVLLDSGTINNVVMEDPSNFPSGGPVSEFVSDFGIDNQIDDFDDEDNTLSPSKVGKDKMASLGKGRPRN